MEAAVGALAVEVSAEEDLEVEDAVAATLARVFKAFDGEKQNFLHSRRTFITSILPSLRDPTQKWLHTGHDMTSQVCVPKVFWQPPVTFETHSFCTQSTVQIFRNLSRRLRSRHSLNMSLLKSTKQASRCVIPSN